MLSDLEWKRIVKKTRTAVAAKQAKYKFDRDRSVMISANKELARLRRLEKASKGRFIIPPRRLFSYASAQHNHDLWRRDYINRRSPDKYPYAYHSLSAIPLSQYSTWSLRNPKYDAGTRRVGLELPGATVQSELNMRRALVKGDPELDALYELYVI